MKKRFFYLFIPIIFFYNENVFAQNNFDTTNIKTYKVAVFAPLYLDSVFTNDELRSEKYIPKFIMPAVDFVQGAMIAFDTLSLKNAQVQAFIYDTRSFNEPLSFLIQNNKLDSLDLMIGSVKDADYKQLADYASKKNIPFISATYPNDGGVTGNPFLAIMNSTLKAHCEGIYSYILQNHGTNKIYLCKKPGVQEDKITNYIKSLNEQEVKPLLNIEVLNFDSTVSYKVLKNRLDSNRHSIIIGASLDEVFARSLSDACYALKKKYRITLVGMPNWEGFKFFFKKNAYKDFPILFTTPYYNSKTNWYSAILTDEYNRRYKTRPADMAYKGFESVYLFTKLLVNYPNEFTSRLNDTTFKVFNDFYFRPVYLKKNKSAPDYFENKHLYIMRILNGVITRDW